MNTDDKIKALLLRMTVLEHQVHKIKHLFEIQIQTMQYQNETEGLTCPECSMYIEHQQPGSCQNENCPCGLN